MKKNLFFIIVMILIFTFSVTFLISGCTGESEETVRSTAKEATTEVTEGVAESKEEVIEEDMNEADPFISEHMAGLEEYYTAMKLDWITPEGDVPTAGNNLILTKGEVKQIQDSNYTYAVIENNLAGEYSMASTKGIEDLFAYLNVEQIAFTSAEWDPAKQKTDVETVLALNPDVIIGHPIDKVTSTEIFKPIVDAGIPIAIYDTKPEGWEYGREMIGLSGNDGYGIGRIMAEEMNRLLGDEGKVGFVYYDDVYYICNVIDEAAMDCLETNYPTMEVVEKTGWVVEDEAGDVAAAIIQKYPDIEGLFGTYMVPAMYMVGACKEAERDDIVIVTFGVDMPVLLNLIEGGNIKSVTTDTPYYFGFNVAILGAYGLLGKDPPGGYFAIPNIQITLDNIKEVWDLALNIPFPNELEEALQKVGK